MGEGWFVDAERGGGDPPSNRASALAQLSGCDALPDPDEMPGPLYWPGVCTSEACREWAALRTWVEQLMVRFPHLDHHVVPRCWFRHNGHVEALVALRDYEWVSYADTAPGTAAADWHRAFRDIEARLREWTAQIDCGAEHEPDSGRRSTSTGKSGISLSRLRSVVVSPRRWMACSNWGECGPKVDRWVSA